jgi:hypothetical protein
MCFNLQSFHFSFGLERHDTCYVWSLVKRYIYESIMSKINGRSTLNAVRKDVGFAPPHEPDQFHDHIRSFDI